MEMNTIILLAIFLGIVWLFFYGMKKLLDAETYKTLTNKIVAYIIKAEADISGFNKGKERLNDVVCNITKTATRTEQKLLKKIDTPSLVTSIFTGIVAPILFKKMK